MLKWIRRLLLIVYYFLVVVLPLMLAGFILFSLVLFYLVPVKENKDAVQITSASPLYVCETS